jgi:tRNA(Ile)-lysidine synthase TilS/MesJ
MHLLARSHDGPVQVLVVDHGLRPAAADEAAAVVAAAEGLGLTAHRVNLKYAPDIRFRQDDGFDASAKIDALLNSPKVKQDLSSKEDDEA